MVGVDRMILSQDQPSDTPNFLDGKVIGEEFVGATATIYVETTDGKEIKAQKSHDEVAHLDTNIGARIYASWQLESAHILPGE